MVENTSRPSIPVWIIAIAGIVIAAFVAMDYTKRDSRRNPPGCDCSPSCNCSDCVCESRFDRDRQPNVDRQHVNARILNLEERVTRVESKLQIKPGAAGQVGDEPPPASPKK